MKTNEAIRHLPRLVGLLFLYAGTYKMLWPGQATMALEIIGLSKGLAGFAVSVALMVEMYLGVLLLTGIDHRYALGVSIALMPVFTVYLFYLSTLAHPPSCGCVGLAGIFNSSRHEAVFGLLRNCVILWMLKLAFDADAMTAPKGLSPLPVS